MISAVIGFGIVAGLLTMIPGVDTALVLQSAVAGGTRAAYATVAGIATGLLVWGVAAAIGISALLTTSQVAYEILRLAGAAYMVVLGARMIWLARSGLPSHTVADADGVRLISRFLRGLLTNLLNPKIGLFYVAVLPAFLPPDYAPLLAGVTLALVHVVESLIWFSLLILGARLLGNWLNSAIVRAWLDRITGAALIGFGIRVALQPH